MKNLSVNSTRLKINKMSVHKLVYVLSKELNFKIDSMEINFINSDQIKRINSEYLDHNNSTDIISFNYSGSNTFLDGELFISYQDAERNSKKYKVSLNKELNRLIIHGILHLVGYNDYTASGKKIMKTLENQLTYKNNFALL
ncbi:MAG: rRNA maturation RNase YbeY [Ignavibacteriaceae bacterium]